MNITTESFLDTTTDFISNETYIHPLLEPYNIVNPILAVIGIGNILSYYYNIIYIIV